MIAGTGARAALPVALAFAAAACGRGGDVEVVRLPVDVAALPAEAEFLAEVDRTRGYRDCFRVIEDPALVPAAEAPRMTAEELVLGLDLGAVQVAYPVNLLNFHEIVEHSLAGLELLACW